MKAKRILLLLFLALASWSVKAQFYAVGSDVIALASTRINAELSMTLDRTRSLHATVHYSPFVFSDNTRFQNLTLLVGWRLWARETYAGAFIGTHALASRYHVGNIWNRYRYDGRALGGGISFGKAYALAPRWNAEWEIGGAVVWTSSAKYASKKCGTPCGKKEGVYLTPTKVSASLIYLF